MDLVVAGERAVLALVTHATFAEKVWFHSRHAGQGDILAEQIRAGASEPALTRQCRTFP